MQPNVSMWLSADAHNNNNSMDMDTGMRTPKYYYSSSASVGHGHRRILNDVDEYQPHTPSHDPHYQSPSEAKRARHVHHHLAVVSAPEIPLRQSVHDLPRPQIHGQPQGYPQSSYSQGQPSHYPLLPPLTVSSISPSNSTRPLIGLAPLRSVPRRCRQLGCANTAKIQELCPDHHQQQVQQTNQSNHSQYHMSRPYSSSPMSSSQSPMVRPTLPQVRYEFSIPSMLSTSSSSSSSPLERHHQLSPFSHHHHQQQLQYPQDQSRPILPTLKSVGLDGHVSPLANINTISSPASSTSSYSSYDHGSETSAAPTPTAAGSSSASTMTLSSRAVTAAFASTSSTRVSAPSSSKPATKCRREHCVNAARRKGLCMEHGGRHFCKMDGCSKCAHRGGFCISHGGGRRCAIANCAKSAQSGGICYSHGGGKRCATDGCTHAARSGGFCIKHGKQQQVQQHSSQYHSQQYDEYE